MQELWVGIIVVVVLLVLVVFIPRRHLFKSKYDGELRILGYDEDTGHPHLELTITTDPKMLAQRRVVSLKMVDETK